MASSKEIRSKISTVGNIKKITSAMEMIARTKMKRAVDGVLSIRPYALYTQELLKNLGSDKTIENPYLEKKNKDQGSNKVLLIVIAGDKGLCGGYNANIIREFRRRQKEGQVLEIIAIGKKAVLETKKAGLVLLSEHANIPDKITTEFIHSIAEQAREKYLTKDNYSVGKNNFSALPVRNIALIKNL